MIIAALPNKKSLYYPRVPAKTIVYEVGQTSDIHQNLTQSLPPPKEYMVFSIYRPLALVYIA